MASGGWFSRMFSRSTTKDFDARSDDEMDGDEHIDESEKHKQGTSQTGRLVPNLSPMELWG
jgi:hypothetical protein